jgi:hypothetical protein
MPGSPHFFVDRSLGRIRVPGRLRAAGWELTTLAEHYGIPADEDIPDIEWLTLAGTRGWAVLMKDDRIRRRPAEQAALKAAGVHAFCIANATSTPTTKSRSCSTTRTGSSSDAPNPAQPWTP